MASLTEEEAIVYLRETVSGGEHWYIALLQAMARWRLAEETLADRHYRYLIGGEAFDWLLLAERLLEELNGEVSPEERDDLLFFSKPPLEVDEEEFQRCIGTPKYQAYLNYLYGVTVEEALQLAVEQEIHKESHGHVWSEGGRGDSAVFLRIYGRSQIDLLHEFRSETGLAESDAIFFSELKEFTYWLFKYRLRVCDGARVASDTRKALVALSRIEAARRALPLPLPRQAT